MKYGRNLVSCQEFTANVHNLSSARFRLPRGAFRGYVHHRGGAMLAGRGLRCPVQAGGAGPATGR